MPNIYFTYILTFQTVQFILSNARYIFLPVSSFVDWLHSFAGIPENVYKEQKFFVWSLHCSILLQMSVVMAVCSFFAMFSPIMNEIVSLQNELNIENRRSFSIIEVLMSLPPYGYIQKFMFFQLFCFLHGLLVIYGFKARLPIFFAPSQFALLIYILKLIIDFGKGFWYIIADSYLSFQQLNYDGHQIQRFYGESNENNVKYDELFDDEILPLISATISLAFFLSVVSFEYIIERTMQCLEYEYFITDTKNYMEELIRERINQFRSNPAHAESHYCFDRTQPDRLESQYCFEHSQYGPMAAHQITKSNHNLTHCESRNNFELTHHGPLAAQNTTKSSEVDVEMV